MQHKQNIWSPSTEETPGYLPQRKKKMFQAWNHRKKIKLLGGRARKEFIVSNTTNRNNSSTARGESKEETITQPTRMNKVKSISKHFSALTLYNFSSPTKKKRVTE